MLYDLCLTSEYDMDRDKLRELGFKFDEDGFLNHYEYGYPTVEINTMEELNEFIEKWGKVVIIPESYGNWRLEIYNGWRE